MTYKKWALKTFMLNFFVFSVIGGFNYFMDPLWTFNTTHKYNQIQDGFNERQQKTNYITFQPFNYDSLILGSSRTTYINQNDFNGINAYNYAANSMDPVEYNTYIEYAKKIKGSDFEYIILGIDFFGTNANRGILFEKPEFYINKSNEFLYRYKPLISIDTLKYSVRNINLLVKDSKLISTYDRNNIKKIEVLSKEQQQNNLLQQLEVYDESVYGNYAYKDIKSIFTEIKNNNPNTKFIIYTTPISTPMFEVMVKNGRMGDYRQWIEDSVDVFEEVYNFMYPNSITNNLDNYVDAHHFKPEIGTLIAHKVTKYRLNEIPNDFGVLVTEQNIESHLNNVEDLSYLN